MQKAPKCTGQQQRRSQTLYITDHKSLSIKIQAEIYCEADN